MYSIKLLKDCWESHSYFGFKDGNQYTDGYDSVAELLEDYPAFDVASVDINGYEIFIYSIINYCDVYNQNDVLLYEGDIKSGSNHYDVYEYVSNVLKIKL